MYLQNYIYINHSNFFLQNTSEIIYIIVNSKVMHKREKIRTFYVSSASKRSYRLSGDPSIIASR